MRIKEREAVGNEVGGRRGLTSIFVSAARVLFGPKKLIESRLSVDYHLGNMRRY